MYLNLASWLEGKVSSWQMREDLQFPVRMTNQLSLPLLFIRLVSLAESTVNI